MKPTMSFTCNILYLPLYNDLGRLFQGQAHHSWVSESQPDFPLFSSFSSSPVRTISHLCKITGNWSTLKEVSKIYRI